PSRRKWRKSWAERARCHLRNLPPVPGNLQSAMSNNTSATPSDWASSAIGLTLTAPWIRLRDHHHLFCLRGFHGEGLRLSRPAGLSIGGGPKMDSVTARGHVSASKRAYKS